MSNPSQEVTVCQEHTPENQFVCSAGHPMIHKEYYDGVYAKLQNLRQEYARLETIVKEQERLEAPTLNHMLIEQKYGEIQITLRGKTKLFKPQAVLDMIRTLKQMYNHAKSYSGPVMVHCSQGIEKEV